MPYIVLDDSAATAIPATSLGAPLTNSGETLLSMDTELDAMMGIRADITPTRRRLWINAAYIDFCSSIELEDLAGGLGFNLVVNQPIYKLPPEVGAIRGKFGVSAIDTATYGQVGGRPLEKKDLDYYRQHGDLVDEPKEFFKQRQLLVIWPTPANVRAMSVDFWITPQKLVNDTDSPFIPVEWHEAILLLARHKGFARVQNYDKAQQAENDFISFVRRRIARDEREDSGRLITSSVPRQRVQIWRRYPSGLNNPRLLDAL